MTKLITTTLLIAALTLGHSAQGQSSEKITTMDFVQILDGNKEETLYYYNNNWKVLREQAIEKGYIHSYQLLEVPLNEDFPVEIILITTYANQSQYDQREDNFGVLIEARGGRNLLNEKQPSEFRKIIFSREDMRYLVEGTVEN